MKAPNFLVTFTHHTQQWPHMFMSQLRCINTAAARHPDHCIVFQILHTNGLILFFEILFMNDAVYQITI